MRAAALKKLTTTDSVADAINNIASALFEAAPAEEGEPIPPVGITDAVEHLAFEFGRIASAFEIMVGVRCRHCGELLNSTAHSDEADAAAKDAATRAEAVALVNAGRL